jgi:hypothetical protein
MNTAPVGPARVASVAIVAAQAGRGRRGDPASRRWFADDRRERADEDHERQREVPGGDRPAGRDERGLSGQRQTRGLSEDEAAEGDVAELRRDGKEHRFRLAVDCLDFL